MKLEEYKKVVTIKDLWQLLIRRLWVMLFVAVISVVSFWGIGTVRYKPMYESTATLYILRQNGEDVSSNDVANDFSLALKVVNDCTYLLKGHAVLDQVISDLNLDMSYDDLYDNVYTSNPENTRILEVTVRAETAELAKEIVDRVCEIGQASIADAMGFEQVNFHEHGILNNEPCNTTSKITYMLIGITAAVVTYSVFLFAFLLDDNLRTNEDIENYLGLSILGEIPDAKDVSYKHFRYYSAYGRDGKKPSRKR